MASSSAVAGFVPDDAQAEGSEVCRFWLPAEEDRVAYGETLYGPNTGPYVRMYDSSVGDRVLADPGAPFAIRGYLDQAAERLGSNRACVAIARKLLARSHHTLHDRDCCA